MEFAASTGFVWPINANGGDLGKLTADQADAVERGIASRSDTEAANHKSAIITQRLVIPSESLLFRNDPIVIMNKGYVAGEVRAICTVRRVFLLTIKMTMNWTYQVASTWGNHRI